MRRPSIRNNVRIIIEHVRDSPKLDVFAAICRKKLYRQFFFADRTARGHLYLDMLKNWLMLQLEQDPQDFIFQQDWAPPHFHNDVRGYLNEHLPRRWIRRTGRDDEALLKWPPRSPDMTPRDFFLWDFVKESLSHHCLEIWWSCESGSEKHLLPLQETCWCEYGRKWTIA